MSDLPPPDAATMVVATTPDRPAATHVDSFVFRTPRAGDLTPGWRIMTIATWVAVFFAFAGVWKASEEIGIGTWWLGSRSQPTFLLVRLIPFALATLMALAATYNVRGLPWIGLGGSVAIAGIGIFDFSWAIGLAVTELLIALGVLLVAAGSFTGRYRAAPPGRDTVEPG